MLDFAAVRNHQKTIHDLAVDLTIHDLRQLTNEMVNTMLDLICDCTDEDVVFVPHDPTAYDSYASNPEEANIVWTLGHVIVHTTASSEEPAFLAAELARGVPHHGRSRAEQDWKTVKTVAACRHRLEESRRMRLASLDMWPDQPHLDNLYQTSSGRLYNPIERFLLGLSHDDVHLPQIAEIVRQAKAARS